MNILPEGNFVVEKSTGEKKFPCGFPKVILQKREFVVDYSAREKRYSKESLLLYQNKKRPPVRMTACG